jgi:predicted ATPase/DNA-binding winged helix-turn-helix (wHTH) protein
VETKSPPPVERAIWFGPFCLRPTTHLLLEGDKSVQIGLRALDLLIALVERAGEVVSKEELLARVWPGLTVDEGNLRTQMTRVRQALRDGQDGSRYVMTVPGRGYRFVSPLSTVELPKPVGTRTAAMEAGSGLPTRLTSLVGRADAVNHILGCLSTDRLVTIIGPGGIGKTSVALVVAEQAAISFRDGVCVVDCGSLSGTSLVARQLTSTLGLEITPDDPTRGLIAFLNGKRMLIVLDCCERVIQPAAILVENLLRGAPNVSILTTSREPLGADGEIAYRLPPLETPPTSIDLTANEALAYAAVRLFVERAASKVVGFSVSDDDARIVADICRRLDGIALAIEMAAARVDVFGLLGVAARLEDRIRLLTHGRRTALPRHQTLAATLDWSYDALLEIEQATLRRLSVFVGAFTFDAANAVAADDLVSLVDIGETIASLVSKSLLNADVATAPGYYRLLDTTRAYASDKLIDSGELDQTAKRHAIYIHSLLERTDADAVVSNAATLAIESKLISEARVAIDWAFSASGDIGIGIALTVASVPFLTHLSLNGECCRYVEQALLAGKNTFERNDRREMQLMAALGAALVWTKGSGSEADRAFTDALEIAQARGDTDYQIRVLWGLWSSHFNSGRIRMSLNTAKQFRDAAADHGDTAAALVGERTIGMSLFYLGDNTNSRLHAERMLRRYFRPKDRSHIVRFQFDPRVVSRTLLSKLLWAQGAPDQAMNEAQGAVDEATTVGHPMSLALTLAQGACPLALLTGNFDAAERAIGLLLRHTTENALDLWHAWGMCFSAMLSMARGDTEDGLNALYEALDGLPQGAFFAQYAGIQATLAEALGTVGAISSAHTAIDNAIKRSERDEERWYMAEFLRVKGDLLRLEKTPTATLEAEEHLQRSLECAQQQNALSWELRTAISLARLFHANGRRNDALNALTPVYGRFKEGFETMDLAAARILTDELVR